MNLKEFIKLKRTKLILVPIIYFFYFVYLVMQNEGTCLASLMCSEKTHRNIPDIIEHLYPGSSCGQVCATNFELFLGYSQLIFLHLIIPVMVIFLVISLIMFLLKR